MRTFFSAMVVVAVATGLAGCQSSASGGRTPGDSIPHLDAGSARVAGLLAQEVSDATRLYVAKCARCHKFYNPAEYSDEEWRSWLTKMSRKARLKPEQQELLSRYLDAFRTPMQRELNRARPSGSAVRVGTWPAEAVRAP